MRPSELRPQRAEPEVRRDSGGATPGGVSAHDGRHKRSVLELGPNHELGYWGGGRPEEFRVFMVRQLRGPRHGPVLPAQVGFPTLRGYLLDTDEYQQSGALEEPGAKGGFSADEGTLFDGD